MFLFCRESLTRPDCGKGFSHRIPYTPGWPQALCTKLTASPSRWKRVIAIPSDILRTHAVPALRVLPHTACDIGRNPARARVYTRHMKTSDAPAGGELAAMPDEDLMLLVAGGFIEVPATELFLRHNRALYNFVAWLCQGNIAAAEDITQRTWEKIMTRCSFYSPQAAFRTFLFQIARNLWLDQNRSAIESLRESLDDALVELPTEELAPEAELALRQNLDRVHLALMKLPVSQREVVALRFFSEMTLEEIAHTVGTGFETVKSRLRYAFTRLRRELEAS